MHLLGSVQMYMKSLASESKPLQSRSMVKIPSRARREEQLRFSKNLSENFNYIRSYVKEPKFNNNSQKMVTNCEEQISTLKK